MKLCFVVWVSFCHAQDNHFSQYLSSPLNLNPALTGLMEGNARIIINHRNQWRSITSSPYVTMSASFDMTVLKNKMDGDWIGVGMVVINDRAGQGSLSNMKVMLSGSYFKTLSKKHLLSFGIQTGWMQRKIDFSSLTFDNQYTGKGFNPALPPGENFPNNSFNYLDLNTGLFWLYSVNTRLKVFTGSSVFHLFSPKETFLAQDNRLAMRGTLYGGAEIQMGKVTKVLPSILYVNQKAAQEFIIGASLGYNLVSTLRVRKILYFGLYYRNSDAVITSAAFEYESWKLGISFDANVSSLVNASRGIGAPELSLKYEMPVPSKRQPRGIECPRF